MGYCHDLDPMPANYNPATYNPFTYDWSTYDWKTATRHTRNANGTYPADYDADDYAWDGADAITSPDAGAGATLYSICFGSYCRVYPNVNNPASAENLGRYMAYHAGDQYDLLGNIAVSANHGQYYFAPSANQLPAVFQAIADNMNTVPSNSWAKGMGGTGLDVGYRIAVDLSGNVYTTGIFSGTADFDPGAGIFNLTSAGGRRYLRLQVGQQWQLRLGKEHGRNGQ